MCKARANSRFLPILSFGAASQVLISPNGAADFSHGWSSARCKRAERNPWKRRVIDPPAPDGAEELSAREADRCYFVSSGTPFAPPGRKENEEEPIHGRSAFHGLRVGPQGGRAAPPAATFRGPVGAKFSDSNLTSGNSCIIVIRETSVGRDLRCPARGLGSAGGKRYGGRGSNPPAALFLQASGGDRPRGRPPRFRLSEGIAPWSASRGGGRTTGDTSTRRYRHACIKRERERIPRR